jgi:pyruvate/2-oxoglutarate dehydrogenase complex dihydrolipoamide dehydrogenase (E3) component
MARARRPLAEQDAVPKGRDMRADVLIIGTGQAGVPLASRLAAAGKRVLIAERAQLGGTCTNVGCTPTKTMIASARAAHVARTAGRLGVRVPSVEVDLGAVVDRKDAIVARWRAGVQARLDGAGERLTLVRGQARFVGPRRVEIGGQIHEAAVVVINVGARPVVPPIDGLDRVRSLDNHTVMQLREVPRHLVILGGGYIGCEFGQMFRRFGARVTIVDRGEHLLGREDPDVSAEVEKVFRSEGIELRLGVKVERISGGAGGEIAVHVSGGGEVRGSHLLVAVGRRPNTDDLGCDAGGVALDDKGYVRIDDGYRATAEGTYAVGDATAGPQFTHASWDDHRLLFDILMGRGHRGRSSRTVPYTVFTDPQVAGVGIGEREARKRGVACEVATMPFGDVARAIEVDETAGLLKLLLDPARERILGARIVGAEAGELIHQFVWLMRADASPRAIVDAEAVHPTFSEGVQSVVMKLKRFALD